MAAQTGRFKAFVKLGSFLRDYLGNSGVDPDWEQKFDTAIEIAGQQNGWFTRESIRQALSAWAKNLEEKNLEKWLAPYSFEKNTPSKVAIIMAGNIPLVGFHDFLAVLLSGNSVLAKLSSGDKTLLPLIGEFLIYHEPALSSHIHFIDGQFRDFDAVIATGSDNSARYFEYYFRNKPNIIRKNRNSAAILTGNESDGDLQALGNDIFDFFGLGCRNVSKLYVPQDYEWSKFYEGIESFKHVADHQKYANNYDYNKAVYLMSDFPILDNGFLLLKEDNGFASPIGTLFYETYTDEKILVERLQAEQDKLQCVVGPSRLTGTIPFGSAQEPELWDYADGVDTLKFLSELTNDKIEHP